MSSQVLVAQNRENGLCAPRFAGIWSPSLVLIRNYQTVSEGFFSETGLPVYGVLGSPACIHSHRYTVPERRQAGLFRELPRRVLLGNPHRKFTETLLAP